MQLARALEASGGRLNEAGGNDVVASWPPRWSRVLISVQSRAMTLKLSLYERMDTNNVASITPTPLKVFFLMSPCGLSLLSFPLVTLSFEVVKKSLYYFSPGHWSRPVE